MKRGTRGVFVNLILFALALTFIVHSSHKSSSDKTLAWTRILYKPTSIRLPEPNGRCPGLQSSQKPALVVARLTSEDSEWLDELSNLYTLCVYTVDGAVDNDANHLRVPANRAHEAMSYLTFMIDNYENIPTSGAVFVHGSRWSWHNDEPNYDNSNLLHQLNVSKALRSSGYQNLRCDWSASTCVPEEKPQGSIETYSRSLLEPWNARVISDKALPGAFATLFGGNMPEKSVREHLLLGRSDTLRAQCCAQFVVAKERILQHSREEYVALRQWLLEKGGAPRDDKIAGRILSYIWHVLFLPREKVVTEGRISLMQLNALACPDASDCYCRLYNRCDLQGCTSGHCPGQYVIPPNFKVSNT